MRGFVFFTCNELCNAAVEQGQRKHHSHSVRVQDNLGVVNGQDHRGHGKTA